MLVQASPLFTEVQGLPKKPRAHCLPSTGIISGPRQLPSVCMGSELQTPILTLSCTVLYQLSHLPGLQNASFRNYSELRTADPKP